jgi:hypothetical protein
MECSRVNNSYTKTHNALFMGRIDIYAMGEDVEDPNNYPRLKQYDAWCR